jgi:hypothetical protein
MQNKLKLDEYGAETSIGPVITKEMKKKLRSKEGWEQYIRKCRPHSP